MVFIMSFLDTIKNLRVGVSDLSKQDRPRSDCFKSLIGSAMLPSSLFLLDANCVAKLFHLG